MTLHVREVRGDAPAADAEVDAFLDACPSSFAQQTVAWREVITRTGSDRPVFLGCWEDDDLVGVLPAYRFEGPLGAILTSVPQAGPLGGVAIAPDADPDPVYRALLDAYLKLARDTDCALASLITNPLWPDRPRYERAHAPDFVLENVCQVLDLASALSDGGEIVGAGTNLSRNLRKASSGAIRIDDEQTPENVASWYGLHVTRHREIGATPLPEALFVAALEHAVPKNKARFFFVRDTATDAMVGGGFYVYHAQVMDALMPAMRREAAALAPNYLLAIHSMCWARDHGIRYYNWQASPPDGGVHRFKRQWGSTDRPYAYLTWTTGDAAPFLASTVAEVSRAYPWHYVLPFDRIGVGAGRTGPSARRDAWAARESERE